MARPRRLFAFRLSLALGCLHPDFLLKQLTSKQVAEWEAYSQIEPFGGRHRDSYFGLLMALIANTNRDPKRRSKPFKPVDFMIPTAWDKATKTVKQTPEQILNFFKALKKSIKTERKKGK